ncbi:DUF938 domain-containing protein [Croceicoccus sp. BE223]|uniref:DUF938 domain-containing protein n=1 Tax=Croceicoccus sp. BE223 TaxID=2817716 RepID=UPI002856666F|nr:DUF938 domain-containing protein [Croceicoccus sp. BE223]MDR7104029.1 hypothetical protein [Croceicoccus sp. BE223]
MSDAGSDPVPFELGAGEGRQHAPATLRNRDAIAAVLSGVLPGSGTVLEIASGTGEHAVHFARLFPHLSWQPSDHDAAAITSIAAWRAEAGSENLLPPLRIDLLKEGWPIATADAVFCANMTHIAPWPATLGLFGGADRVLPPGAPLIVYGPFLEADMPTAPSNLAFDASLRSRNPEWGLRSLSLLDDAARTSGLVRTERHVMPANNLSLVFRKARKRPAGSLRQARFPIERSLS